MNDVGDPGVFLATQESIAELPGPCSYDYSYSYSYDEFLLCPDLESAYVTCLETAAQNGVDASAGGWSCCAADASFPTTCAGMQTYSEFQDACGDPPAACAAEWHTYVECVYATALDEINDDLTGAAPLNCDLSCTAAPLGSDAAPAPHGYASLDVDRAPGTRFAYSGGGFLVLQHLLEAASGAPAAEPHTAGGGPSARAVAAVGVGTGAVCRARHRRRPPRARPDAVALPHLSRSSPALAVVSPRSPPTPSPAPTFGPPPRALASFPQTFLLVKYAISSRRACSTSSFLRTCPVVTSKWSPGL
mgnify:CR=1 FL=1